MNEYGGIRGLETKSCFNPRARAGRDWLGGLDDKDRTEVSIHAPVRGATPIDCR